MLGPCTLNFDVKFKEDSPHPSIGVSELGEVSRPRQWSVVRLKPVCLLLPVGLKENA